MSAIEKLTKEMDEHKQNPYVQYVGNYLINLAKSDNNAAKSLEDAGKTIIGSLDAMRKVAEKSKVNNMAVIAPDHGLKIVCDYFGLNKETPHQVAVTTANINTPSEAKPKSDLNFEDLFEV